MADGRKNNGSIANFNGKCRSKRNFYSEQTRSVKIPTSQVSFIKRIALAADKLNAAAVLEQVAADLESQIANLEGK